MKTLVAHSLNLSLRQYTYERFKKPTQQLQTKQRAIHKHSESGLKQQCGYNNIKTTYNHEHARTRCELSQNKQPTAQKQISMKKRRATLRSIYNDGLNADDILCPRTEYI